MKTVLVTRRQSLRAAGGFSFGLPFLPSIVKNVAHGAEPRLRGARRFVAIMSEQGGVRGTNLYPPDRPADTVTEIFPGHAVRSGPLQAELQGSESVLSPLLRAPSSLLSPRLLSRLNVLRGFDIPFSIAHHTGGHLGNYARNDGNDGEGKQAQATPWPTIDNVLAWSSGFYQNLGGIRQRTVCTGDRGGYSWSYSNPAARTGTIQAVGSVQSPKDLFDAVIGDQKPAPGGPPVPTRPLIVDRVRESYLRLKNGDRRLSNEDRRRLDAHIARLDELERTVRVQSSPVALTCGSYPQASGQGLKETYQLRNSVVAMALLCGASRIATMSVTKPLVSYPGSWHQDTAHACAQPEAQNRLVASNRNLFDWVFLDLASKLDVEDSPGETVLDNSLVQWTIESGFPTHHSSGLSVITAGSAGGYFKTGLYVDYRRRVAAAAEWGKPDTYDFTGLTYNRWLATALQAMGLPRQAYERAGHPGYGQHLIGKAFQGRYVPSVVDTAHNAPPLITT